MPRAVSRWRRSCGGRDVENRMWRKADGQWIAISAMETSHVVNCISLIERRAAAGKPWREEYLERLRLELTIRSLGRCQ